MTVARDVAGAGSTDLPADWLESTLADLDAFLGRTGPFPCSAAVAYHRGIRVASRNPGSERSALLDLLRAEALPPTAIVTCAIEPAVDEADDIALLASRLKVAAVTLGALHPSPALRGRLAARLRAQGVVVHCAADDAAVSGHDRRHWAWARFGRPYIHLKISLTADAAVVPTPGHSTSLAGRESKARIHDLRGRYDAVLVGANTVRLDDPQLTYRGEAGYGQPRKIILSRTGQLPPVLRAFRGEAPWICAGADLSALAAEWGRAGITSVLVEGGFEVYRQFIGQDLMDEVSLIWTPRTGGTGALRLPGRLPLGERAVVGEDVWETLRWPVHEARCAPGPQRADIL